MPLAAAADIQERNRIYRENLDLLREQLRRDFTSFGNAQAAHAMEKDDDLGLTTIFYIMLTSCGIVDFSKNEPSMIKNCRAAYDIWDKKHLCLAGAEDLLAAVAIGAVDDPHAPVLCAPGVLSPEDLKLFNEAFEVVYSEHDAPVFSYGALGKFPLVDVPDWAYYVMSQNTLDLLSQDILNERHILCVYDMPHPILVDHPPVLSHSVVLALCLDVDLPEKMYRRPSSMNFTEGWKVKALSSKFVISPTSDADMRHVYDIYKLWNETCKSTSVASIATVRGLDDTNRICENIGKLSEVLGMDSIIDAYMAGVPIEDLLA